MNFVLTYFMVIVCLKGGAFVVSGSNSTRTEPIEGEIFTKAGSFLLTEESFKDLFVRDYGASVEMTERHYEKETSEKNGSFFSTIKTEPIEGEIFTKAGSCLLTEESYRDLFVRDYCTSVEMKEQNNKKEEYKKNGFFSAANPTRIQLRTEYFDESKTFVKKGAFLLTEENSKEFVTRGRGYVAFVEVDESENEKEKSKKYGSFSSVNTYQQHIADESIQKNSKNSGSFLISGSHTELSEDGEIIFIKAGSEWRGESYTAVIEWNSLNSFDIRRYNTKEDCKKE